MKLLLTLLILGFASTGVYAQPGSTTRARRSMLAPSPSSGPWSSMFRYSVVTDYADNRRPRGYTHAILGTLGYSLDKNWSLELTAGGRAETMDGQVEKGREQTYDEVLSPSTSVALGYEQNFLDRHKYSIYLEGEPLWDEASRREGYRGIVGGGGNVSLRFFGKRWVLTNDLSVSELINSYHYGSNLNPNPDYFWTYKLTNVFKIYHGIRFSYAFGAKVTRYMDDFIGYSYSNSLSLSYVWPHLSVGLAYDNGGFTDDGTISLWYIDQYRRLARFVVGYTF